MIKQGVRTQETLDVARLFLNRLRLTDEESEQNSDWLDTTQSDLNTYEDRVLEGILSIQNEDTE